MDTFFKKYKHLITFNDLKIINFKLSFLEQRWSFKEDLLQMGCQNDVITIDVGWYPEFIIDGCFGIKVIKNYNWSNPLIEKETKDFIELEKILKELAIIYCEDEKKIPLLAPIRPETVK